MSKIDDPPIRYYKVRDSQSMFEQNQSRFRRQVENFCDWPVTNDPFAAVHICENRQAPSPLVSKNAHVFLHTYNFINASQSQEYMSFLTFLKKCLAPSPLVCKNGNVF